MQSTMFGARKTVVTRTENYPKVPIKHLVLVLINDRRRGTCWKYIYRMSDLVGNWDVREGIF